MAIKYSPGQLCQAINSHPVSQSIQFACTWCNRLLLLVSSSAALGRPLGGGIGRGKSPPCSGVRLAGGEHRALPFLCRMRLFCRGRFPLPSLSSPIPPICKSPFQRSGCRAGDAAPAPACNHRVGIVAAGPGSLCHENFPGGNLPSIDSCSDGKAPAPWVNCSWWSQWVPRLSQAPHPLRRGRVPRMLLHPSPLGSPEI